MDVVAINASDSLRGRGHALAEAAVGLAGAGVVVDLASYRAEALLGRVDDTALAAIVAEVAEADMLVVVTPVYRSTYSGLLKLLVERLPRTGLRGAVVLAATAGSATHGLVLDADVRPLLTHVGGHVVRTTVYTTPVDVDVDGRPLPDTSARLAAALAEAERVAVALRAVPTPT